MAHFLESIRHIVSILAQPTLDAAWYGRHLSFNIRLRLLGFQPIWFLTNAIAKLPYIFRRPFTVHYIPLSDGRSLRILVFQSPQATTAGDTSQTRLLRPLHIDVHPGGFVGGLPEVNAPFCELVANQTGAVVIALSHRVAPVHPFPAAIDDIDEAISWLHSNSASHYGADPTLMTVSGSSAGGNLVLAATQAPACHAPAETAIKGSVTFYAPVDLHLHPAQKPKSPGLPKNDPMAFLLPLFDSYAAPVRDSKSTNYDPARMSPTLATLETLPDRMIFVVPGIDVLVQEQLQFAERLRQDNEASGGRKTIEVVYMEDAMHGFLELPSMVSPVSKKMEAWSKGIRLIRQVHEEYGWSWIK